MLGNPLNLFPGWLTAVRRGDRRLFGGTRSAAVRRDGRLIDVLDENDASRFESAFAFSDFLDGFGFAGSKLSIVRKLLRLRRLICDFEHNFQKKPGINL